MNVLNLVTFEESRCFRKQVQALEARGVSCNNLSLPGRRKWTDDDVQRRSIGQYLRFYPTVLRHSLDSYDVVHANYGLTAPAAIGTPHLPMVLSLWGSDLMGEYGWVSKLSAKFADAVIVMSEEMARELSQPCHVIPHGVDLEMFKPMSRKRAQKDLGWNTDRKHVLFPYAKTREVKNYPRAKRVFKRAHDRYRGAVEFQTVTSVPHERMVTYMNAADVLLLTSDREGSPNTVKEALACNLPVVSTDVGDVKERLSGVTPSVVARTDDELVDGLVTVLRADTRSNGRQKASEIGLEKMGERIESVYKSVIS